MCFIPIVYTHLHAPLLTHKQTHTCILSDASKFILYKNNILGHRDMKKYCPMIYRKIKFWP